MRIPLRSLALVLWLLQCLPPAGSAEHPSTFTSELPLLVVAEFADGHREVVGQTPLLTGESITIPPCRTWWVRPVAPLDDAGTLALCRDLAATDVPGLSLAGCEIGDFALAELHRMRRLRRLDLGGCEDLGDAAVALVRLIPGLQELVLRDVPVHDRAIALLADLPTLHRLDLGGTAVGDGVGTHLQRLQALTHLSLADTGVGTTVLTELPLDRLVALDLGGTRIRDADLALLGAAGRLQVLGLRGCKVGDAGLALLRDLPGIRELDLGGTRITAHLTAMVRLERLDLGRTRCGLAALTALTPVASLRRLELACCRAMDDGAAAAIPSLQGLRQLVLRGCPITDAGIATLAGSRLELLDLADTEVSDAGLARLGEYRSLRLLRLAGCDITDAGLAHLQDLNALEVLDLADTRTSDAGVALIRGIGRLRALDLADTRISGQGMLHLRELVDLERLDLSRTRIGDHDLDPLRRLPRLRLVDAVRSRVTPAGATALRNALAGCAVIGGR